MAYLKALVCKALLREFFHKRYTEKHDEETAETMADMGEKWIKSYTRLAVIEWPEFAGRGFAEQQN